MINVVAEDSEREQENAIEALLDLVFGPGRFSRSAYRLREGRISVAGLSFLAFPEDGEKLLGAIRYWSIRIGAEPSLLLGPLVVHPEHQGEGIGLELMKHSLQKAEGLGYSGVLLVGDEPYYQRVGFATLPIGRVEFPGPVDGNRILWRGFGGNLPEGRIQK